MVGQKVKEFFFSGSQCHFIFYIVDEHGEAQDLNVLESVLHSRISVSVGNQDQLLKK